MSERITVGMDMGDKNHSVCVVDAAGEVETRDHVTNTRPAILKYFRDFEPCRIAGAWHQVAKRYSGRK